MTDAGKTADAKVSPAQERAALRKAEAEAELAEANAAKAKREEAEAASPAAVARRAVAAEKDASQARREQVAALLPDLTKVARGELTTAATDHPTAGTNVAARALEDAARSAREDILAVVGASGWSMLVTTDADLATSDAGYLHVAKGLERFKTLATSALDRTAGEAGGQGPEVAAAGVAAVGALMGAVPGLLSLFSAHRKVSTGAVTIDDFGVSVALAGALKDRRAERRVFHDAVRLAPSGGLATALDELQALRDQLVERKTALEARKPQGKDEQTPADLVAAIGLVTSVAAGIDAYLESLTAIPEDATRSALTTALLRQGLHDGTFTHAVVVKAHSASGAQMVNDKPFGREDTFAVIGVASITWALLEVPSGELLNARVSTGTAQGNGKIGDTFTISSAPAAPV